ncbi:MAG: N-6 DNA methylase, partial [Phototrophicales bacterium]|nr:N-6 DNA methylase [Phototrophicales bacterium]
MTTTALPPITKEDARAIIRELVAKFTADRARHAHNEQKTREYYILPLFRALGWDTENPNEFTAEEQISRGFVDFGFYLHGVPVFYLETKRPNESLDKPDNIRQAIRYAYMRGVTWAILTDFEQVLVYNAEWEENDLEKIRFLRLNVADFADADFDDLWLLSKPAFMVRELDKKAERYGKKAKREPVTTRLFRELTAWRKQLFDEFRFLSGTALLDNARVDNAVQRLIDRLIFIRSMEDRGIEPNRLLSLVREDKDSKYAKRRKETHLHDELQALFTEMDGVYNSNIFAHSDLDELQFKTAVADIIEGLYGDRVNAVRYDFNAISADVLGAVYEQYLSFKAQDPTATTDLTAKSVKRKTQGIYYTPQFIVRYIVQNTLGKALQAGIDPLKIRVLDPACGSGSFLIEAFDVLDRWLAGTFPDMPTPDRRDHILRHNLYGVDLDIQAVEVTRLNLLLRAAGSKRLLPPLTHIQHGDSLVTHKFDYHTAFDDVFAAGGFDVVVGNPPYVRQETLGAEFKDYVAGHYTVYAGTADLYVYFIERGLTLLKQGGALGYILPNKWMRANYGKQLR